VLQTTKSLARPVDLHHHKYVPPTSSKYKWEAPKLSPSGPPSAPVSPSPFIQGPRSKPWVPNAPSVVQILEDVPEDPPPRRLPIYQPPAEEPEIGPAVPLETSSPVRPITRRALAFLGKAGSPEEGKAPSESGRGRRAVREGSGEQPRSLSVGRGRGRALDRDWGSAPLASHQRASSSEAPIRTPPAPLAACAQEERSGKPDAVEDGSSTLGNELTEEAQPPRDPGDPPAAPAVETPAREAAAFGRDKEGEDEEAQDSFPAEQQLGRLKSASDLLSTSDWPARQRQQQLSNADLLSTSDGVAVSMHRTASAVDARTLRAERFSRYAARTSAPVLPLERCRPFYCFLHFCKCTCLL
jgi:hypothetical protein